MKMRFRSRRAVLLLAAVVAWPAVGRSADAPVVNRYYKVGGHSIVNNPDGSWSEIRVRNVDGQFELSKRISLTDGITWQPYTKLVDLPSNDFGTIVSSQIDAAGEIQTHIVRPRGAGGTPAVDYFLDLWQVRSSAGQTQWSVAQPVFQGYVSDLQQQTLLSNGRIVLGFNTFVADRPAAAPIGNNDVRVMYSDDRGGSWQLSPTKLTTPVRNDFNGDLTGGVEPMIVDQPSRGRQWMLIRTQADYLYESVSTDNGSTWSEAKPSIFASSDSPADYQRLPDGRLMMFWSNARNTPKFNGAGVYSGRDALHSAISENDGVTWRGFREIYIDPTRHQTPPATNDRGTAIPAPLMMRDNRRVAVMTGQGPAAAMLYIDPEWLYETTRHNDMRTFDELTAFTSVGPASNYFRNRVIGPEIIADPGEVGDSVLRLNNPNPGSQDGDGAVWNFTMGTKGRLTMRMRMEADTKVADIQLADRFFDPTDDTSLNAALFDLRFNDRGEIVGQEQFKITKGEWHELALEWDLRSQSAMLSVDGALLTTLTQLHGTGTGVSYLRLRSPFVSALDPTGWMVDWVDVNITDALTITVPEPATLGALACASVFGVRRRAR